MANTKSGKLSTESYKGVRDFYPEQKYIQNYIFDTMSGSAESFGYLDYSASLLEPTELYESKTSEEIVGEQTYTFEDRGGRSVTLRPEMTPSVARMVAGKKRELTFPLRLYTIANVFRYERPQRGRLREHWQLNADIFGVSDISAEIEIISLASCVMENLGAKETDFEIRIGSRELMNAILKESGLSEEDMSAYIKLLDKTGKMPEETLEEKRQTIITGKTDPKDLLQNLDIASTSESESIRMAAHNLEALLDGLKRLGIQNATFDSSLARGFDYYTGIIFEIFDTSPDNNRSLFGGGRYDNLMEVFGGEQVPAVGFGMGDVTITDFLETRGLLPEYQSPTDLYICTLDPAHIMLARDFAQKLRSFDVAVAVNYTDKKVGDQIKMADKSKIPFVLCIGDDEIAQDSFIIKNLKTGNEERFEHVTESDGYKRMAEHIVG